MGLVDDDTRCQVSGPDIVSLSLLSLTKYSSVDSNITPYYENTERTRNKDFNETKQAFSSDKTCLDCILFMNKASEANTVFMRHWISGQT